MALPLAGQDILDKQLSARKLAITDLATGVASTTDDNAEFGYIDGNFTVRLPAAAGSEVVWEPKYRLALLDVYAVGMTTPLVTEAILVYARNVTNDDTLVATLTFAGGVTYPIVRLTAFNNVPLPTITPGTYRLVVKTATGVTGGATVFLKFANI